MNKIRVRRIAYLSGAVLCVVVVVAFVLRQRALLMEHPRYLYSARISVGEVEFVDRDGRSVVIVRDYDGDGLVDAFQDFRIPKEPLWMGPDQWNSDSAIGEILRRNTHQRVMIVKGISEKMPYVDMEWLLQRLFGIARGSKVERVRNMRYWRND